MPEAVISKEKSPEQQSFGSGFFATDEELDKNISLLDNSKSQEEEGQSNDKASDGDKSTNQDDKPKEPEQSEEEEVSEEGKEEETEKIEETEESESEPVEDNKADAVKEVESKLEALKSEYEAELLKLSKRLQESEDNKNQQQQNTSSKMTHSQMLESLDMSDIIIDSDGNKRSFKEIREEFPEVVQTAAALADKIADAKLDSKIKNGEVVGSQQYNALAGKVSEMEFFFAIMPKHADVMQVIADKDFHDWVSKQSPFEQEKAKSGNPLDAIAVLDRYKSSIKPTPTKKTESKQTQAKQSENIKKKAEKEYTDRLYKNSARNSRGPSLSSIEQTENNGEDKDDWMAGFNEAGEKDKK